MTLAACMKHSPIHRFGMGWRCSRCNVPITNPHGMIVDMPDEPKVEINHTEAREFDEFVKRQVTAAATLLEISWRESLRKERDARLTEVRLKEKYKQEAADLRARLEALQGTVR